MELEYNTGESPVSILRFVQWRRRRQLRGREVRWGAAHAVPIGHNESEPHLMSLLTFRTRESSFFRGSEDRREPFESSNAAYWELSFTSLFLYYIFCIFVFRIAKPIL